ncbi:glycerate kinase [Dokdonia ponticola]|uniref:Glycerate kinase n=1 Tax=Dokdonia ponticola TaxID=2041041 RepID=A0ABV9HW15_9FLAO
MKFVIAPDKYKGSLSGFEFCDAVEEGLQLVFKEATILKKPLADGGDGTIAIVKHYLQGSIQEVTVLDPLFRPIKASYFYDKIKKTAFIEMAEASGLKLLKKEDRNCMHTTTFGTGELILDALKKGASKIILGIGGSATNDGGMGMATALGYQFLDIHGQTIQPIGANLSQVATINDSKVFPELAAVDIVVACDVTNPLYGPQGSAYVYAKQKGASSEEIAFLDVGLQTYAQVVYTYAQIDVQAIEGAGAAGGMGAGSHVFLKARLTSGVDLIKEIADFDTALKDTDWIITGEGQLDQQTLSGKTISGVIAAAKQYNIPVAAFCGSIDVTIKDQEEIGITYATSILSGICTLDEAIKNSYKNLVMTSYNFAKTLKL